MGDALVTRAQSATAHSNVAEAETSSLLLEDQLCFSLNRASRLLAHAYRPLLDPLGITYPQYLVLLVLWERDGLSVGDIGKRLHVDTGTLTPLLKRMEKQQLLERRRSSDDDRVVENLLTGGARALRVRAEKVALEMLCRADLRKEDVQEMKSVVGTLVQKLLSQGDPRRFRTRLG